MWLSVPFTFLGMFPSLCRLRYRLTLLAGLVAEAGSSVTFRNRSKYSFLGWYACLLPSGVPQWAPPKRMRY